jgi:hypothetical protein
MRYHDFHFKSTKKIWFYKINWDPLILGKKQEIVKERQAGKANAPARGRKAFSIVYQTDQTGPEKSV